MFWATEQPWNPVDFGEYHARATLNQILHAVGSATKRIESCLVHENTVVIDVFKILLSSIRPSGEKISTTNGCRIPFSPQQVTVELGQAMASRPCFVEEG